MLEIILGGPDLRSRNLVGLMCVLVVGR